MREPTILPDDGYEAGYHAGLRARREQSALRIPSPSDDHGYLLRGPMPCADEEPHPLTPSDSKPVTPEQEIPNE